MKNRMITATGLCVVLMSSTLNKAENKTTAPHSFKATDLAGDSSIAYDLAIGFVDSFAIMGECDEGLRARKEIEAKRDLASQEIQEESKKLEKSRNDYISKSTT